MTQDDAEALAVDALSFIASDEDLMTRFLSLSGVTVDNLRTSATEPGFLVGVLDYLAGHEPDLLAFAHARDIAPERIMTARHTLAPDQAGYA